MHLRGHVLAIKHGNTLESINQKKIKFTIKSIWMLIYDPGLIGKLQSCNIY